MNAEDAERPRTARVTIDERRVAELRGPDATVTAVTFADGGEQSGAAAAGLGSVLIDAVEVDAISTSACLAFPPRATGSSSESSVSPERVPDAVP